VNPAALPPVLWAALGAILGGMAGPRISWAIRSWPGHEAFVEDYHDCARCPGGIKRRCCNAGQLQDRFYQVFSVVIAAVSGYLWGPSLKALLSWVFSVSCLIITVVDVRYLIIPDLLSIKGTWAGLLYALLCSAWVNLGKEPPSHFIPFTDSLIGVLLGGGSLWLLGWLAFLLLKKEGMGGGDVKLLAAIGAWLGWKAVLATILIASLCGSIGGIASIIYARIRYRREYKPLTHLIPFGPYLCLGFLIVFYAGLDPLYQLLAMYQRWVEHRFMGGPPYGLE